MRFKLDNIESVIGLVRLSHYVANIDLTPTTTPATMQLHEIQILGLCSIHFVSLANWTVHTPQHHVFANCLPNGVLRFTQR